jgi:hypothetical protein
MLATQLHKANARLLGQGTLSIFSPKEAPVGQFFNKAHCSRQRPWEGKVCILTLKNLLHMLQTASDHRHISVVFEGNSLSLPATL